MGAIIIPGADDPPYWMVLCSDCGFNSRPGDEAEVRKWFRVHERTCPALVGAVEYMGSHPHHVPHPDQPGL